PLRAWMRYSLLLQLLLPHGSRCPQNRELYAHPQRHALQGADGFGSQPGPWAALYRSRDPRAEGNPGTRGHSLRAGPRVSPHPAELREHAVRERAGQLERRAGTLPDGPPLGGGWGNG